VGPVVCAAASRIWAPAIESEWLRAAQETLVNQVRQGILAEKLGATSVAAIDYDDWSIENAAENSLRNNCQRITLRNADTAGMGQSFDIILANINKNVILENMALLADQLNKDGLLLLSGLLADDEGDIMAAAAQVGLRLDKKLQRNNWISLRLRH